jgi:hypothetical protein
MLHIFLNLEDSIDFLADDGHIHGDITTVKNNDQNILFYGQSEKNDGQNILFYGHEEKNDDQNILFYGQAKKSDGKSTKLNVQGKYCIFVFSYKLQNCTCV